MLLRFELHFGTCKARNGQCQHGPLTCAMWCEDDSSRCCKCVCFPATARLSLDTGETKTMDEIKRGDKVKTGAYKSVKVKYYSLKVKYVFCRIHEFRLKLKLKQRF